MRQFRAILLGIGLLAVGSGSLRADAIDGNWCFTDGRSLAIKGPSIVTPAGSVIAGDYDRHGFAYVVPTNEDGAGSRVVIRLLNEQTMRLSVGEVSEVWRRCSVVS